MNSKVKIFLKNFIKKVDREGLDMLQELSKEENVIFLHNNIFGKAIALEEIEEFIEPFVFDGMESVYAREFATACNKLEKMFRKVRNTTRQLRREHGYK